MKISVNTFPLIILLYCKFQTGKRCSKIEGGYSTRFGICVMCALLDQNLSNWLLTCHQKVPS